MNNFEFCKPTHYYFGSGTETEAAACVRQHHGSRVLLVYGGGSCVRSGLLRRIKQSLNDEGLFFAELGGVKPNPRADLVYAAIDLIHQHQLDFILAIGGGSVIDTAKAAAAGALHQGDFFEDFFVRGQKPVRALPVGVVLTIPAAGSEGSDSAVIQKEVNGIIIKKGLSTPLNVPAFALLNPELTFTLPSYQTACGAADMLAHVMERYFTNTRGVSVTDRIGEAVMLTIIENLPQILIEPDNYDARANLMWAGMMAHNNSCGVGREQDWASHHLEHQLSALYDVAHGAGLAVIFPAWMEYTLAHNPMRFAQFAHRVFGVSMDFEDPRRTAKAGIQALRQFFKASGLPLYFKDIGAKADDIPKLLDMLGIDHHSEGHFVVLNRDDCEKIYRIAAQINE